jgi:type I restriction enzyme, S subunit
MAHKFPENWKAYKLDQLGLVGRGRSRHRPRNEPSLYGGEYPFFQTGDIKAANLYLVDYTQTYNEKGLSQSKLWDPGTLCITIAANIADTAILGIRGCFPDSVIGFMPNKKVADVRFIKYYIDMIKLDMQQVSHGTTQDNLSLDKLLRFDFIITLVDEQRKIAAILSAYNDLIENNLRRIKILEEMAQNLYREWFVNFRFPGHEQTRFVDSPLGRIPEGWEVLEFRNLFDIKYGKTLPKTKISKHGLYPVYGAGDIIGYYDQMICAKKCVLVTSRGNGSGTVWRTRGAAFITNNSLIIKPKPGFNHWDYTFIELLLKNSNVMEAKTGSAQPQVTIENLNYVKGLVPESKCVERFCAIALPIYEFIDRCLINNNILRQTRDLLLPKLISGEVDVLELDIKVPEEKAV